MLSFSEKVTRNQTKQHNQSLILKVIYDAGEISRADIARATGFTRATVSNVVNELFEEGLVAEIGRAPSGGGKPPKLLHVVPDARQVIGVDLADNRFQGCVYDLRGQCQHSEEISFTTIKEIDVLELVYQLLDRLMAHVTRPLLGIGVGTPGLLDAQEGFIHVAVNLGWRDLPLSKLIAARYEVPVYLVNDTQAAAMAQYTFSNSKETDDKSLIVMNAGRGISAGIIINGQLYHGSLSSGASEIGHLRVVEGGELCACGHFGCLETVASSRAIVRWAKTIFRNNPDSKLHDYVKHEDDVTFEIVVDAFHAGDQAVRPAVEQAGRYLGAAAANLTAILNIRQVILAGSLARFGDDLLEPLRYEMRQCAFAALVDQTKVGLSPLGGEIVMLGAAALLLTNELGVV